MEYVTIDVIPHAGHMSVYVRTKVTHPGSRYPRTTSERRTAHYVIQKPVDLDYLLHAVEEAARRLSESRL